MYLALLWEPKTKAEQRKFDKLLAVRIANHAKGDAERWWE